MKNGGQWSKKFEKHCDGLCSFVLYSRLKKTCMTQKISLQCTVWCWLGMPGRENPAFYYDWVLTNSEEIYQPLLVRTYKHVIFECALMLTYEYGMMRNLNGSIHSCRCWLSNQEDACRWRENKPSDLGHCWTGKVQ